MLELTLWVLQGLLALAFLAHGWIFLSPPANLVEQMNAAIAPAFRLFIGGDGERHGVSSGAQRGQFSRDNGCPLGARGVCRLHALEGEAHPLATRCVSR
jgi:hypothetical protein